MASWVSLSLLVIAFGGCGGGDEGSTVFACW